MTYPVNYSNKQPDFYAADVLSEMEEESRIGLYVAFSIFALLAIVGKSA